MTDLDLIQIGVPHARDGCPVLQRVNAFVSAEGVPATLQYTFVDGAGDPLNLDTSFVSQSESDQASSSLEIRAEQVVLVKFREFLGYSNQRNEVTTMLGEIIDPSRGFVQVPIPDEVYAQCGIYQVDWGFIEENSLKCIQNTVLSVERSLFGHNTWGRVRTQGPPTLGEIRMWLWDNPRDNPLLGGDVEFSGEQILQAIAWPIEYYNSTNPPISIHYDTRNFPWRNAWFDAIKGRLYMMAADWYMRNRLKITGGGKELDPLNRSQEYMKVGMMYQQRWEDFTVKQKCMSNLRAGVGHVGSDYGRIWGIF